MKLELNDDLVKHMVNRFLGWKLPEHFHPDDGISFEPYFNVEWNAKQGKPPQRREPTGTNLFDATQATEMVRYMLEGCTPPPVPASQSDEALVPRDVAESWRAKAENYQQERDDALAAIAEMMAKVVSNWPAPKKLTTAITLIGKTFDAMVSVEESGLREAAAIAEDRRGRAFSPTELDAAHAAGFKKGFDIGHEAGAETGRRDGHAAGRAEMREEAAKACEEQRQIYLSPEYATGQPLSSILERMACTTCADAIRTLEPKP